LIVGTNIFERVSTDKRDRGRKERGDIVERGGKRQEIVRERKARWSREKEKQR
jgi:hypothetical protein